MEGLDYEVKTTGCICDLKLPTWAIIILIHILKLPTCSNQTLLKAAFESAGVEFIPENGGGAGVRLKRPGQDHLQSSKAL
jgi:hypothetical protein